MLTMFVGPSPEPPNRVPRMHNVVPGAKAYIASLQLALQRAGGKLICNAHVHSLERSGDRVAGWPACELLSTAVFSRSMHDAASCWLPATTPITRR